VIQRFIVGTAALWFLLAATAAAQPNDYSNPKSWLCRPGQHDACDVDLTTTVIAADGTLSREPWSADPNAPIDCFYVYPTVSTDPTPNSDMTPEDAERNVIRHQFARFASKCRPYAPMYRQITLAGLQAMLGKGGGSLLDHGVHYDDVRDAWNYYLEHDNRGRGFVLIGHSQGSFVLTRLIKEEIDGKPVQARLVSAILLGTNLAVPFGKDVGGVFQHVPLCRATTQTGCVITYASFRATAPPPANTLFGRVPEPNWTAACNNPAALAGGSGELHAYLATDGSFIVGKTKPKPWVTPEQPIETPWVSVPGLLSGQCMTNDHGTYLEISVHPDPSGHRTDEIVGDLKFGPQLQANWGLHLIDVNLSMGNLLDIVGQQSKAWLASSAKSSRTRK
jgi:Protein of unknown function (DUF3089)